MIGRLVRAMARWSHAQHVRDLDWQISHHERHLAALPREIRRLNEMRRFHRGRMATLSIRRNPVSWSLARIRGRT